MVCTCHRPGFLQAVGQGLYKSQVRVCTGHSSECTGHRSGFAKVTGQGLYSVTGQGLYSVTGQGLCRS